MSRPLSFWVCVFVYVLCLVQVLAATDILAASVSPALSLPRRGRNQTDNTSLHPRGGDRTGIISVPPTRTGLLAQHDSYTHNVAPYPVLGVSTRGRNRTGRISLQPTRAGLLEQAHNYASNGSKTAANTTTEPLSHAQLPAGDTQHDPSNVDQRHDYSFIESIVNISKHRDTSRPVDNTLVLMLAEIIRRVLGVAPPPNTSADAPDDSTHVPITPKTAAYEPLPHFRHARRQRSAPPLDADPMQIHTVPRPSQHKGHTTHTQTPRWKQQMLDQ